MTNEQFKIAELEEKLKQKERELNKLKEVIEQIRALTYEG